MATAAGWERSSWFAVLIPCLIGPTQQAVDTVPLADLNDYDKVQAAIIKMLSMSPEAYRRRLRKIDFGPEYQPRAIGQQFRAVGL